MHAIKRMLYAMLAVAAMLFATTAFATSANAAPYTRAPTLSVSTSNPAVGGTITVAGADFLPGTTVNLTLQSASVALGSATVNSAGAFSLTVTLPSGVSGTQTLVATDSDGKTLLTASLTIVIGSSAAGGGNGSGAGGNNSGGGGLASTGVAVVSIVAVGLLLLVGGGVMLMTGRRRKAGL